MPRDDNRRPWNSLSDYLVRVEISQLLCLICLNWPVHIRNCPSQFDVEFGNKCSRTDKVSLEFVHKICALDVNSIDMNGISRKQMNYQHNSLIDLLILYVLLLQRDLINKNVEYKTIDLN